MYTVIVKFVILNNDKSNLPYGRIFAPYYQIYSQIFSIYISRALTIILLASTWKSYLKLMKKCKKLNIPYNYISLIDQLPFHGMYFLQYRDQVGFSQTMIL